jgi:hypothetical protein
MYRLPLLTNMSITLIFLLVVLALLLVPLLLLFFVLKLWAIGSVVAHLLALIASSLLTSQCVVVVVKFLNIQTTCLEYGNR